MRVYLIPPPLIISLHEKRWFLQCWKCFAGGLTLMPRSLILPTIAYSSTRCSPKTPKSAPSVSFVSLGCPKALVDSERILTQLRAEGYARPLAPRAPTSSSSTPAAFSTAPRRNRSTPSARRWPKTARSSSPAAWAPSRRRSWINSLTCWLSPGRSNMRACSMPCTTPRRPARPVPRPRPPEGASSSRPRHYAYLKISEGCNNRCTFCIIRSCAAISSRGRPPTCCARPNGWSRPA